MVILIQRFKDTKSNFKNFEWKCAEHPFPLEKLELKEKVKRTVFVKREVIV